MKKETTRQAGDRGEELARRHLKKKGYKLIESNYRCPRGEIDVVAKKGRELVFVEVRAKTGDAFGTPEESITAAKISHLIATAHHYRASHENLPEAWRIDVVAIELDEKGGARRIEIIEHALGAGG
jgi:putative endonuclease